MAGNESKVALEIFAAKDGDPSEVFVTVPHQCGLAKADALMVDGERLLAMREQSILPIDFPELDTGAQERLRVLARLGCRLTVAEFVARGVADAYFLKLVVVE